MSTELDMTDAAVVEAPTRTTPVLIPTERYTSPEFFARELAQRIGI